jgi:hypothetical protein
MLARALAISLIGTMLSGSAAYAQTRGPIPNRTLPATGPTGFLTQEQGGQWRASKLERLAVYDHDHHRVGESRDILVDRDGKAAVVIGMGGFLGVSEHDVALPFSQITVEQDSRNTYRCYPNERRGQHDSGSAQ